MKRLERLTRLVRLLGVRGGARAAFKGWQRGEDNIYRYEVEDDIPGNLVEGITLLAGEAIGEGMIAVQVKLTTGGVIHRILAEG